MKLSVMNASCFPVVEDNGQVSKGFNVCKGGMGKRSKALAMAVLGALAGSASLANASPVVNYGYSTGANNFTSWTNTTTNSTSGVPAVLTGAGNSSNLLTTSNLSLLGGYNAGGAYLSGSSNSFTAGNSVLYSGLSAPVSQLDSGSTVTNGNQASYSVFPQSSYEDLYFEATWATPQNISNILSYAYNGGNGRSVQIYDVFYSNSSTPLSVPGVSNGTGYDASLASGLAQFTNDGWTLLDPGQSGNSAISSYVSGYGSAGDVTVNSYAQLGQTDSFNQSGVNVVTGGITATQLLIVDMNDGNGDRFGVSGGTGTFLEQVDVLGSPTPEPAAAGLVLAGAASLLLRRKHRQARC